MKVYSIGSAERGWEIYPRDKNALSGVRPFDCQPLAAGWVAPRCYVHNPKKKRTDFAHLSTSALVVSDRARELMWRPLEPAGELLPLDVEDEEPWWLLNVLECINCLDKERTVFRTLPSGKRAGGIIKYAFHEPGSFSSVIKIPETSKAEVLTVAGLLDPLDEFYGLYHHLGLTGLKFEELWSSEETS